MSKPQLILVLLAATFAATAAPGLAEPVFVRGTIDGAFVRLPDVRPGQVQVDAPDPRRFVITAKPAAFSSGARWPRAEFIEHVQVFGPELLGGETSRVVLRTTVSRMSWRLEQDRTDTLVILTGATPLAVQATEARDKRKEERAERRAASEDEAAARRAEREERRARAAERRNRPAAPTPDSEADRLRAQLAATEARLRALERRLDSGDGAPAAERRRDGNETARLRPAEPSAPAPSASTRRATAAAPMRVERTADGMVRVPGGRFTMGTPLGHGFEDEVPAHPVELSAFELDEREVSVGEFQRSPIPLPRQPEWNWDSEQPVVNVTWHEAAQYCEWASKRLPTEAEWEKAARGTDGRSYPWGNRWSPTRANSGMDGDGHVKAAPVGSFPLGASPYGALDLAGNVWEWTHDWYDDDAYESHGGRDPRGPTRGTYRVARGGSFEGASAMNLRAAIRMPLKGSARRDNVGFRCAR